MQLQRRAFLTGLGSLFAAPAIVHATNLMPVKAIVPGMRCLIDYAGEPFDALEIRYGYVQLRPEWTLDKYSERILRPHIDRLAEEWRQRVEASVFARHDDILFAGFR